MKKPESCRNCVDCLTIPGGNYVALFCLRMIPRRWVINLHWKDPAKPFTTPDWCPRGEDTRGHR
jgi:hypothetical protein